MMLPRSFRLLLFFQLRPCSIVSASCVSRPRPAKGGLLSASAPSIARGVGLTWGVVRLLLKTGPPLMAPLPIGFSPPWISSPTCSLMPRVDPATHGGDSASTAPPMATAVLIERMVGVLTSPSLRCNSTHVASASSAKLRSGPNLDDERLPWPPPPLRRCGGSLRARRLRGTWSHPPSAGASASAVPPAVSSARLVSRTRRLLNDSRVERPAVISSSTFPASGASRADRQV